MPKFRLVALTVNCGLAAAVLVPLNVTIVVAPLDELLLIVICPLAAPVCVGSNCTWRGTDWVGLSVTGKLPPTIAKPGPVILAEFIVTGAVPTEVRASDCVVEVSTITSPKLKLPELTFNSGLAAAMLVPFKVITVVPPVDELLLIVICPLAAPLVAGSNCT